MLSDAVQKELADYLYTQGREWAEQFIAGRRNYLRSRGIKATDELVQSLEYEVSNVLEEAVMTRIEISFEEYGRYIDLKALKTADGGGDYIEGLKGWIRAKGLESPMVDKYMQKRGLQKPPQNVLNYIAWGIVIKRKMSYKRKQWWNKAKSAAITDLYNNVAAGLPDLVADEIKKAFKNQA